MTAVAAMAHATVSEMASVAVTATQKAVPQVGATTAMKVVAPARKAIPKLAVKADAAAVVDVAAVVVAADVAKAKDHHKVKAKPTASVLTPKVSHNKAPT